MATQRHAIAADAVGRLSEIHAGVDDFETDAGEHVFIGERPELGKNDPDEVLAVVFGDDEVTKDTQKIYLTLPIEIQAVVKVGPANAWSRIESMLGDIKRAMEHDAVKGRRELGGYPMRRSATRTLPREPGSTSIGVGVTYLVDYAEAWGTP